MEREINPDSRLYFNPTKYTRNFSFNTNVRICKYVTCIAAKDFLTKHTYFE